MLHPIEPQHLGVASLLRFLGPEQRRGVVASGFRRAQPAFDRAHMRVGGQDADGVHAFLVVGADRAKDHVIQIRMRRMYTEERLGRDDRRADIQ